MRKIVQSILTYLVVLSTLTVGSFNTVLTVDANNNYPIGCGTNYEISWVNDQGGFDQDSCYNNFNEAINALKTKGADYVVRHHASLSPSKIVAVNSGIAYSYAMRSNSKTLNVVQNVAYHQYRKTTYVANHRELAVPVTRSYDGNGDGEIVVQLTGFEGFVSLKNIDLIPMKILERNLPMMLGGNTMNNSEAAFSMKAAQSHYKVIQNGNYKDLVYYYCSGWSDTGVAKFNTSAVGPAASWMNAGDVYYSYDHQNFFTDRNYINKAGEYFSYYQYLPLRSKTKVNPATFEKYLNNLGFTVKPRSNIYKDLKRDESQLVGEGQTFINNQNTYGVNGLFVFALACLESGNGRSQYAVEKNNLFGWGAIDSDPDQAWGFSSISQGIMEQMAYNLRNYLDTNNANFFGMHIGNKGSGFNVMYASDPNWGLKIASLSYEIDKLDNNYNGNLTDYNAYTVGVIDEYATPVYREASASNKLFDTKYGATYQKNFTTILLENVANFTKFPSPNLIVNGAIVSSFKDNIRYPATAYDFNTMVGYVASSKVRVISGKPIEAPVYQFVNKINEIKLYDSNLQIEGLAYKEGPPLETSNLVKHTLKFIDENKVAKEFVLQNLAIGKDEYKFGGYIGYDIDISAFTKGTYDIVLSVVHNDYTQEVKLSSDVTLTYTVGGVDYVIKQIDGSLKLIVEERVLDIPNAYNTLLKTSTLNADGILSISGIAMIEGYNNSQTNTKHELELISLDDATIVKSYNLTSHTGDYNLSDGFNHKLDYSYGWYKGEINLNELPIGDYSLNIKTTVKGIVKTNRIYAPVSFNNNTDIKLVNGLNISLTKQYLLSNRLHISMRNYTLSQTQTNLPSFRESYSYFNEISYNEVSNNLKLSGTGYIWNANFGDNDSVEYTLHLANRNTGEVFEYKSKGLQVLSSGFGWDNNVEQPSDFDLKNTWFEFDIDGSVLSNGIYDAYLAIKSNEHLSIVDIASRATIVVPNYKDESNKIHVIGKLNSQNKGRLILDIQGIKK